MNGHAEVRSIDELRAWLAAVSAYRADAAETISSANMEIQRGHDWVAEQLSLWQKAVRECEEQVQQAKMELASRKMPNWDGKEPDTTIQERNLRRAKARLEHAEEKVRVCRSWVAKLPKAVEESYSGPSHRLSNFLDGDLTNGLALLDRQIEALEKYAGLRRDFASNTTLPASPKEPPK